MRVIEDYREARQSGFRFTRVAPLTRDEGEEMPVKAEPLGFQCRECKSVDVELREIWPGCWVNNDHVKCRKCGYVSGVYAVEPRSLNPTGTYWCGSGQEHWDGLVRCEGQVQVKTNKGVELVRCTQSANACTAHEQAA